MDAISTIINSILTMAFGLLDDLLAVLADEQTEVSNSGAHPHPQPLSWIKQQYAPRPGDLTALFTEAH